MSVEAMAVVLHHSEAKGTDKVVLLGIANHEGDGGAWPAVDTLARYANVDATTVRRSVRRLVELGELEVQVQGGGGVATRSDRRPNLYRVLLRCPSDCDGTSNHRHGGAQMPARAESGGALVHLRGGVGASHGGVCTPAEPSLNHPEPIGTASNAQALEFDKFWQAYPRKVGKRAAVRSYQQACKRVESAVIVDAARALAADPNLPDLQFVPYPATWLNRDGWHDGPCAPRSGPNKVSGTAKYLAVALGPQNATHGLTAATLRELGAGS